MVSFFQAASLVQQKTPNKACSGRVGVCGIFKAFFWLRAFSTSQAFSYPATRR
jgi:hypothetical protein